MTQKITLNHKRIGSGKLRGVEHNIPVSVVLPCFRCAETVERAISSIIQQTQSPAEVIMVDDASGDETMPTIREIEAQYPELIKVLALNTNSGPANARNAGWAVATQPYIAFIDSDDSWHPDKLKIQYEFMLSHPDVALSGHQCVHIRNGDKTPSIPEDFQVTTINARSLLVKNAFSTPTAMLKSNIDFRFKDGKRCAEDLFLWQQISFGGLKVVRLECPLAYVHKAKYGDSGLSAQLWKMQRGELDNFSAIYRAGHIDIFLYIAATLFSVLKFFKRLFVSKLRFLKADSR